MSESNLPPEQWRPYFDQAGIEFGYRPLAAKAGIEYTRHHGRGSHRRATHSGESYGTAPPTTPATDRMRAMKKAFAALAATIATAGLLSACGGNEDGEPGTHSTHSTAASAATSTDFRADTPQCDEFCSRVARALGPTCDPSGSGAECADILTSKVMVALAVEDSDITTSDVKRAARAVADSGAKFADEKCYKLTRLDLLCGTMALTVQTHFTTLDLKLKTS